METEFAYSSSVMVVSSRLTAPYRRRRAPSSPRTPDALADAIFSTEVLSVTEKVSLPDSSATVTFSLPKAVFSFFCR